MEPLERLIDPPRGKRRTEPEEKHDKRAGQRLRPVAGQPHEGHERQRGREPHLLQRRHEVGRRRSGVALRDLRRGLPFKQAPLRERESPQRARDGVGAEEGFVRQGGQRQHRLADLAPQRRNDGPQVLPDIEFVGFAKQIAGEADRCRREQDGEARHRPQSRLPQHGPAEQEQHGQGRRHEAAPEVVEDLGARQRRQRVPDADDARLADLTHVHTQSRQQPGGELPVAAYPTVPPLHVRVVARRRLFHEFDVAEQPAARVAPFEQVVAEDAVFRQASAQHVLERIDLVDALADERTLSKQVLVDIAHCARVRIDAGLAGEQPAVARAVGCSQAHADARLQDAVAFDHPRRLRVAAETRSVQRVSHGGDELAGRIARQLRVGVQRDDVAHVRQGRDVADDPREAIRAPAAQQRVEVGELAALALVAHPHAFARVPQTRTMGQEEAVAAVCRASWVAVLLIQLFDELAGVLESRGIGLALRRVRVVEIGEQGEVQLRIAVGKKAHLERVDQLGRALFAAEHRGNHDERA